MTIVAAILYIVLMPHPPKPPQLPLFKGADKAVHFIMMATLTAVATFDRRRASLPCRAGNIAVTALWVMAFGVATELMQGALTTTRSADIYDLGANWCGTIAAAVAAFLIIKHHES